MENSENIDEIENDKLSYQSIKMVAAFLFILGLILGAIIYTDYIHRDNVKLSFHFGLKDGLPDLANSLLGTTGLCWSLASTLLFFYTILQTRQEMNLQIKEMKITNTSLISQRYQTTFFNLLDNHTRLINNLSFKDVAGQNGITKISNVIREDFQIYMEQLLKKYFDNFHITRLHPYRVIKENRGAVESYIKNFITILNFIETNKYEKEFYKELLSNYLSIDEKVLIGAYVNSFNDRNALLIKNTSNYNYLFCSEYYMSFYKFKMDHDIHFPFINLYSKIHGNYTDTRESILNQEDIFKYNIFIDSNVNSDPVKLVSLNIHVYKVGKEIDIEGKVLLSTKEPFSGNTNYIDLNSILKNYIIENVFEGSHIFKVEFVFDLKGNHYVVKDEFSIIKERSINLVDSVDNITVRSNTINYEFTNKF